MRHSKSEKTLRRIHNGKDSEDTVKNKDLNMQSLQFLHQQEHVNLGAYGPRSKVTFKSSQLLNLVPSGAIN